MGVESASGWVDLIWKIASIVGVIVAVVIVPWLQTRFATKGAHEALAAKFDDHDTRLTVLETQVKTLPTREEIHELALSMERLTGGLNTFGARLDSGAERMDRLQGALDRHEDIFAASARPPL